MRAFILLSRTSSLSYALRLEIKMQDLNENSTGSILNILNFFFCVSTKFLFFMFPSPRCLRLQNLAPHLRPVECRSKNTHSEAHSSPFIYSPLMLSGSREKKDSSKMGKHFTSVLVAFKRLANCILGIYRNLVSVQG